MRFLIDANLSPRVARLLNDIGHSATHVADIGLLSADDLTILEYAATNDRIIISADADFGALLALGERTKPSFVFLRSSDHLAPDAQVELVLSNLENIAVELERGAIVTFAHGRLRVRSLPVSE
ncbi:MAG TPA: DUF5615 family PIN-like protein [Acidimicrobiales bacterium]|nr:DUF5615 family PIN-like protein [Acidimicrobiales bacterium]